MRIDADAKEWLIKIFIGMFILVYSGLASIGLPTMYGDNAFYIGRIAAFNNFSLVNNIQLQGLLEFYLLSITQDGVLFIILYKFIVILFNMSTFMFAFYNRCNRLFLIFAFSVAQFYLAPSMFSYSVAGFSLLYIYAKNIRLHISIFAYVMSCFF